MDDSSGKKCSIGMQHGHLGRRPRDLDMQSPISLLLDIQGVNINQIVHLRNAVSQAAITY